MSPRDRCASLARLAALKSDRDLNALARGRQARAMVVDALDKLDRVATLARPIAPVNTDAGSLRAQEKFVRLVQRERSALNTELARRNAAWRECLDDAVRSFGRARALEKMAARARLDRLSKIHRTSE
ncbi:MAG: hypothetical protein H6901_03790 [Rhodobacteraceae bacterium]|nr:hypothetical protein [Paracoccaceae bacterium]